MPPPSSLAYPNSLCESLSLKSSRHSDAADPLANYIDAHANFSPDMQPKLI